MRNDSILNVHTTNFEEMGYNLMRGGWLSKFTEEKNHAMREDGVSWRGAGENSTSSSPSFSPPSRTRMTLSWIGNEALVCSSFLCVLVLSFFFYLLPLILVISPLFISMF